MIPAEEVSVRRSAISFAAVIVAFMSALTTSARSPQTRQLTFEDRVLAQEAIERVYYSHQIGATKPFDEAVPREVIEKKVRMYLKQSVALEKYWNTPITGETLLREFERMKGETRMPARLRELFATLDNDPVLILECLARPALVDRLTRNFFAFDERIHGEARKEAQTLRRQLVSGVIDPHADDPRRTVSEITRDSTSRSDASPEADELEREGPGFAIRQSLPSEEFDRWAETLPGKPGDIGAVVEERDGYSIWVVLEREKNRILAVSLRIGKQTWEDWWGAAEAEIHETDLAAVTNDGDHLLTPDAISSGLWGDSDASQVLPCVPDEKWNTRPMAALPSQRGRHTAVWTGTLMVVWGGYSGIGWLGPGGRYDPATDTWTPTATTGAPSARDKLTAVWTGSVMIVWGGSNDSTGGRYNPALDTWMPTSLVNAPVPRTWHTAVWTGSVMVVWGGQVGGPMTNSGGRYNPETDTWSPTSMVNSPFAREYHTAIWTGSRMVVWGGHNGVATNTGGRYDPATDTWSTTSTTGAPPARMWHTAVWTGTRMVVWGGSNTLLLDTGGRYDPASDTWTTVSTTGAPHARSQHTAVWMGSLMVVWGGRGPSSTPAYTGGRYDPVADVWTPTSTTNGPLARWYHTAISAGNHMIVWGGSASSDGNTLMQATGGRYDPATDTWTPTSTADAPSARIYHTAVWTGSLMIVWGGLGLQQLPYLNTGSRYDPVTNSWAPTSITGAPSARYDHTAVWTGDLMVVWGGVDGNALLAIGGRYNPAADTWTQISTVDAPAGRIDHSAIWTGNLMVVWGGTGDGDIRLNTGGRYDPTADFWTPTSMTNVPSARRFHSGVWTGSLFVIWGGEQWTGYTETGARYEPSTDTWTPTSTASAPSARTSHSAIWDGTRMIVWGGYSGTLRLNTGGRYDPSSDTWTETTTANAPSARNSHTAIWNGTRMVVWGGYNGSLQLNTGGMYEPITNVWTPTSLINAPTGRYAHTAVSAGSSMIVWGGYLANSYVNTGGWFGLEDNDNDGDGFGECIDDCDDTRASVFPGAPQICDGLNNDCSAPGWPSLAGTNDSDDDGDLVSKCSGDCDDADAQAWLTPGEARNLIMQVDGVTLSWTAPAVPGASSISYDTLRSGSASDFDGSATCLESNDGADTLASDALAPVPGEVLYYLVRVRNTCPGSVGIGAVGTNSAGVPRAGRPCP